MLQYLLKSPSSEKPKQEGIKSRTLLKKCYLWGKKKEEKEKSYHFTHLPQGFTNYHSHLSRKERMGSSEKIESHTGSNKQNKKEHEKVKINQIKLN